MFAWYVIAGFALTLFLPLYVVGLYLGKWHVRRLAVRGGEDRYPEPIPEVVRAYREEHRYAIESLHGE